MLTITRRGNQALYAANQDLVDSDISPWSPPGFLPIAGIPNRIA